MIIQYNCFHIWSQKVEFILYKLFYMENRHTQDSLKPRDVEIRGIKMKRKPMFDETGTTLLNGVKLSFEKGFGYSQNPDLKSSSYCIDDNRIIYLLSSQIVLYDMLAQTQKVIDSFDYDQQVGAIHYFKNIMLEDNIIYALHNCNKSFPSLTVLNFSKNFNQKIMLANLQKQQKIIEIALLNDFRNIATVSKMDRIIRLTIIQIISKQIRVSEYLNFNPIGMYSLMQFPTKLILHTSTQIYITDIEDGLKMIPLSVKKWLEKDNQNITQISNSLHLDFCVYAITDQGNLYFIYIDIKEFKITKVEKHFLGNYQTLDEKGMQVTRKRRPSSICANQYNIGIGYQSIEEFTLVKISAVSSQPPSFESIKFSCPFLHKIVRMSFAAETMAICVVVQVKQNDKYDFSIPIQSQFLKQKGDNKIVKQNLSNHALPPGKVFPIIFNLLLYDTLVQTLRSPVQTILNSMLLVKKILDICVLPTKKLILVLSGDKRIKAIKYEHVSSISFDKMLAWQMIFNANDQPTSLDVHPLTFNIAVGLKQGVKLFTIYSDGMKTTNINFPLKNCQSVKYSRFGHLLIAGSPSQILLISPYNNRIRHTLQLNYSYCTRQLSFIDRDMYIFGCFSNGSSQVMNLEGNKVFQVWAKGAKCVHSCYDPVFDIMIMSFEDHQVKFYREKGEIQFAIMWTYPFLITRILLVNQLGTAFMGTSTGKIRAYQWPFTDMIKFNKSYTELQLHKSAITQIKITPDFSYLITGAEDGTIFISKITPYSDGIVVSDSSILHTFKVNKKNYTSLYYLQNFMCTNNCIQSQKQQQIIQYQSDRADSGSEYNYILQNLQLDFQKSFKQQQQKRKKDLRAQIEPLENEVESINRQKIQLKDQLNLFLQNWDKQVQDMEDRKLNTMRDLYKQSDHLKVKFDFYQKQFKEDLKDKREIYLREFQAFKGEMEDQEKSLIQDCMEMQKQFSESLINYKQLMKQQDEQGQIYKAKMMQQLQSQLKHAKQNGQQLRKVYNKHNHEIKTQQQKSKYFQQITSELSIDIESSKARKQALVKQIGDLGQMLKDKDKLIFNQEKAVKELLKKSINNYSHEEYLKHKQDQLIQKAKYLEKEIQALDDKYKIFQDNFIEASKETNEYIAKIQTAYKDIESLKEKQINVKQKNFMKKYKDKQIYSKIVQCFHECNSKAVFAEKVKKILSLENLASCQDSNQKIQVCVDKRDHLIDQVINTNKLRKIDDTIRKTIMVKLNRQTVNLISQVNQLRKQKKILSVKIRDLQSSIHQVSSSQKQNPKDISSLTDIVPINISIIRSQPSKHKPLPFQVYQHNKLISQRSSTHSKSKIGSKSMAEEGSTHLPSIIKHSQSYGSGNGSGLESTLFGVDEGDQVAT